MKESDRCLNKTLSAVRLFRRTKYPEVIFDLIREGLKEYYNARVVECFVESAERTKL